MKIIVGDTYEETCRLVFDDLINLMKPGSLICPASGDSPKGLYKQMVSEVISKELDVSNWYFVGLDEWTGMNGEDEGSCRFHLNNQLFAPLKIPGSNICFFDGRAEDLSEECNKIENFINEHNGIEVAIVGLGLNGHIGMNEPGTSPSLRSHVAALHATTQKASQKYFKNKQEVTSGITLGLADLIEARHVILLVSGGHKAEIVKRTIEEEISKQLPATLLRNHPDFKIYLDHEAASLIKIPY